MDQIASRLAITPTGSSNLPMMDAACCLSGVETAMGVKGVWGLVGRKRGWWRGSWWMSWIFESILRGMERSDEHHVVGARRRRGCLLAWPIYWKCYKWSLAITQEKSARKFLEFRTFAWVNFNRWRCSAKLKAQSSMKWIRGLKTFRNNRRREEATACPPAWKTLLSKRTGGLLKLRCSQRSWHLTGWHFVRMVNRSFVYFYIIDASWWLTIDNQMTGQKPERQTR